MRINSINFHNYKKTNKFPTPKPLRIASIWLKNPIEKDTITFRGEEKSSLNFSPEGISAIREIEKIANRDEIISKFEEQKNQCLKNPALYVNGEMKDEEAKKEIETFFKNFEANILKLCATYDKETLEHLFRLRLDDAEDYMQVNFFDVEDYELMKNLTSSKNKNSKTLTPPQKLEFFKILLGYKRSNLEYDKTEMLKMVEENKVDIEKLKFDLFMQTINKMHFMDSKRMQNVSRDIFNSWNSDYIYLLSLVKNHGAQDAFEHIIEITTYDYGGGFKDEIMYGSNIYSRANRETKSKYEKHGINFKKWLYPPKSSEVQFVIKDKNTQQLEQIVEQIEEDVTGLMKLSSKEYIKKQLPNFVQDDKFSIPRNYQNRAKLIELLDSLIDKSKEGKLHEIWNRANNNLSNPQRAEKAQNTLTILDHLKQRKKDISKSKTTTATKTIDLTIKMWDRIPQKDLFQGNYSTCCIGVGQANEEAIADYLGNASLNMIELVDNETGKTIGNALCYMALELNTPVFVIDNIEIKNSMKLSNKASVALRDSIVQYVENLLKEMELPEDTPILLGKNYNDISTKNLKRETRLLNFLGEISTQDNCVYLDTYGGWTDKWNNGYYYQDIVKYVLNKGERI